MGATQTATPPALLTYGEAAQIANVSKATIIRRIKSGELPMVKLGGRGPVRIPREPFMQWLSGNGT